MLSRSKEYIIWKNMKNRCYNSSNKAYLNYGGRGIKVCDRWLDSVHNFIEDMGPRSNDETLERNDVDKDYSPDNCRWATRKEQANNKRTNHFITAEGMTLTVMQWSEKTGINYRTILSRLDSGWKEEDSVTIKNAKDKMITFNGETGNITYWCQKTGLRRGTIKERLKRGLSIEETLTKYPSVLAKNSP